MAKSIPGQLSMFSLLTSKASLSAISSQGSADGHPCQPFSVAGQGKGQADERHLWPEYFRLIRACRPPVVMGEQVAAAVGKSWLDGVCADLEGIDYACGAVVVPACAVNAPHRRDRLWFVADAKRDKQSWRQSCGREAGRMGRLKQSVSWDTDWESALSKFRAVDDGFPRRVGATDAARNAIVPQVAAEIIGAYMETSI
jgi:DNA (cytosine-5)-methyltransferase 1